MAQACIRVPGACTLNVKHPPESAASAGKGSVLAGARAHSHTHTDTDTDTHTHGGLFYFFEADS